MYRVGCMAQVITFTIIIHADLWLYIGIYRLAKIEEELVSIYASDQ